MDEEKCHSEGIFVRAGRLKDAYAIATPTGQHDIFGINRLNILILCLYRTHDKITKYKY
jgi:hypothetical protein